MWESVSVFVGVSECMWESVSVCDVCECLWRL